MREEVLSAVRALSDPDHQWRVWVRRELPHPDCHDDLDLNVHVLFDDTQALTNPARAIGSILRSEEEAGAMRALGEALDTLFDKYGTDQRDEEYLRAPEWQQVIHAAQGALVTLRSEER